MVIPYRQIPIPGKEGAPGGEREVAQNLLAGCRAALIRPLSTRSRFPPSLHYAPTFHQHHEKREQSRLITAESTN